MDEGSEGGTGGGSKGGKERVQLGARVREEDVGVEEGGGEFLVREDKKDRKRKGTERQSRKRKADGEEVAATPTHAPCPTYLRTPLQCPFRFERDC